MHDTDMYQRPVAAFLFAVTDPISSLGPDVPERLGKLLELVKIVGELEAAGVGFESTTERIETSTAAGRLVFHVFAALAEFERRLIVERTVAGLAALGPWRTKLRVLAGLETGLEVDEDALIEEVLREFMQAFADKHQGGLQADMFPTPAARKPRQSTKRKTI